MFGQSIKIAGAIVSMLIVFLIFIWALFIVLGSPECDDLANTSAYNLKTAIDQVASEDVPFVDYGDEPQPTEYRTAVIRLCQEDYLFSKMAGQGKTENIVDQIYSWILKLMGGEPQYKLYYEIFPEEGGIWKESYPWNGGAASTLAFWLVMRGVSIGIERLSPVGFAKTGWSMMKWLGGADEVAETVVETSSVFVKQSPYYFGELITVEGKTFLWTLLSMEGSSSNQLPKKFISLDPERREAMEVVELLNEKHSEEIIKALADSNFIRKNSEGSWIRVGSRIAVNDQTLPMIFPKKDFIGNNWVVTGEYAIGVYQPGGGELNPENAVFNPTDSSQEMIEIPVTKTVSGYTYTVPSDYAVLTYRPNELVRDMHNELIKSSDPYDIRKANDLESFWYWEEGDNGETFDVDDILQTSYGFEIYDIGVDNSKKSLEMFEGQGVLTENTVLHSGDISLMLEGFREAAFAGDSDSQKIKEALQKIILDRENGVFEKICYVLNKTPCRAAAISYNEMFDALQSDLRFTKKTGIYHPDVGVAGIMLFWDDNGINVDVKIMDVIMMHPEGVTNGYLLTVVSPFNKVGYSDSEIIDIYNKLFSWFNDPAGGNGDSSQVPKGMGKLYIKRWANTLSNIPPSGEIPNQYRWAVDDIGFMIGLYMQQATTKTSKLPSEYERGITVSAFDNTDSISFIGGAKWDFVKRPLFFTIKQMVTPTSGLAKGMILQSIEGCLGNSICVYSHGALMNPENPYYLSEDAKDFTVKLWRPISPLVSVAGVEGVLMQVPSHPRFYVVSPCFGMAKVWKSTYEGQRTIFIKIDKYDMNDTSSNYCYADEELINQYAAIWFLSTAGDIAQSVSGYSVKKVISQAAKKSIKNTVAKTFLDIDPVSLLQGFAEAWISWPGWPFKSLTWESMTEQSGNIALNIDTE
jgi:hypothetical protein